MTLHIHLSIWLSLSKSELRGTTLCVREVNSHVHKRDCLSVACFTVAQLCHHCKSYLPAYGLKPCKQIMHNDNAIKISLFYNCVPVQMGIQLRLMGESCHNLFLYLSLNCPCLSLSLTVSSPCISSLPMCLYSALQKQETE